MNCGVFTPSLTMYPISLEKTVLPLGNSAVEDTFTCSEIQVKLNPKWQ